MASRVRWRRKKKTVQPCPFCGGHPKMGRLDKTINDGKTKHYVIFCDAEDHSIECSGLGKFRTASIWNAAVAQTSTNI